MENIVNSFSFAVTMAFLAIGGLVNSIVAIPTTALIGWFGFTGNLLCLAYFCRKAYKAKVDTKK